MTLSKDNVRVSVTVSKKDYELLKRLAEEDGRSISNLVGKIIKDYLNKEAGGN